MKIETYTDLPSIPEHLQSFWKTQCFRSIDTNSLYVGLRTTVGDQIKYVNVKSTPHYNFVRHILFDEPIKNGHAFKDYIQYRLLDKHLCSEQSFINLAYSIRDNGYDWQHNPILVFRYWRRIFPLSRWDVADGFHRLAILSALGMQRIPVCSLKRKDSLFSKIKSLFVFNS